MARVSSRLERAYLTKETVYGTAVAPAGTDATRVIRLTMYNQTALLRRRDKTGSRSASQGVRGRTVGRWSFESSLYGSGSAGTVPDFDVLLQMLFGQAATGGVYTPADAIISGDLWSYRRPTTVDQRVSIGSVLQNFQFNLGQDVAEWSCDGISLGVLGSANFSTADTALKGGLGGFPAEPGSQTYADAGLIAGFTGSATVNGTLLAAIRTAQIKGNTGNDLVQDAFGSYYPVDSEGDERRFQFSFSVYDDDTVGLAAIKEAAEKKTAIAVSVTVGTVTGNKFTFDLTGVQLDQSQLDDSGRSYVVNFGDGAVNGTSLTVPNEFTLTCG